MNWLARLSLLLLTLQLVTARTIPDGETEEEEEANGDENEVDENDARSNMPIEQPAIMARRSPSSVSEFIDQEKGWMTVFVKHLALHQKWATTIAGVAVNAHLYGMVASVIFRVMKEMNDNNGGVFAQIRDKLDKRIAYHISKNKIYRAQKVFDNQVAAITAKMHWRDETKEKGYQYEDLLDLRTYLPDFLPHEPSVDYDPEWFQLMASYLMLYKNFYNGLINNGRIHKCVFVQDWNTILKDALIKSVTRLSYSYFSHLQKTARGARLIGSAWLEFEDHIPEQKVSYHEVFTDVEEKVLGKISEDVADIMMNNIGTAYNKLLHDIPQSDRQACGGVQLLTKEDLTIEYPKSCYGTAVYEGETKQCDLPCGKYSESAPYCIFFHGGDPENTEKNFVSANNRIDNCQGSGPDYWRTCARIEKMPDIAAWDEKITEIQEQYGS